MEYEQEYLDRGEDRLGLHVYPEPEGQPGTGPAVVIWPAMGAPARYYRPFATQLRACGLAVVVADLRGTGSSTPRPSTRSRYGYADLAADVGAVLDTPRLAGRRVFLLGHSLGGQTSTLHLALTGDTRVGGLILVAVGLPWYRSYPGLRRASVLGFTQWINAVATVARVWPGWGFGGRQARGVIHDWAYTARHGRFPRLGGVDAEAALATIKTPVLALSVDNDQFTPATTLDQLCAKLIAAPVHRHHVTAGEAGAPLDHMIWVRAGGAIAARVAAFTAGQVTPPQHERD